MQEVQTDESLKERQEDELQVLRAVFMDDVEDLREKDPWKIPRPPELILRLGPQQSKDGQCQAYTHIKLHIRCQGKYPEQPPDLSITEATGLSDQQRAELKQELDAMTTKLIGEVMILELAQHAQDYLHKHNRPPAGSFYDEMLHHQHEQQQLVLKEEKRFQNVQLGRQARQRQEIEDAFLRQKLALKEETRRRREQRGRQSSERDSITSDEAQEAERVACASIQAAAPSKQQHQAQEDMPSEDDHITDIPLGNSADTISQSRLTREFQILCLLGKGGFGDVLKVRNKLDGQFYALKRILLNPSSKQFNRKITREVKLLSRLNHENIVRYYNSWIEECEVYTNSDTSSSIETPSSGPSEHPKYNTALSQMDNDIELAAPPPVDASMSWGASCSRLTDPMHGGSSDDDEDDDDEDDESDVFGHSMKPVHNFSEDVIFESSQQTRSEQVNGKQHISWSKTHTSSEPAPVVCQQFLYIQMEYCGISTLRTVIDRCLCESPDRMWRLFREIAEGLVHIHEQRTIHRDLKPVNIFIDANDHVKIGDFGLATTDILTKSALRDLSQLSALPADLSLQSSQSVSLPGDMLTGHVGTALYVSPEVMAGVGKATYNQKVDIYSLGIILFEMCYRPLKPGMERVNVLSKLRSPMIIFPEDFDEVSLYAQSVLIRWLMKHDPDKRPTSQELLQSDYLPPAQMEESDVNEMIRSVVSNPQSRVYRHLIGSMIAQPVKPVDDFTYDMDNYKGTFSMKLSLTQNLVTSALVRVFERHSAIPISTALLMPKNELYEHSEQYVCLMNKSGGLVSLPYDLRVAFARYVARNNVSKIHRYCIESVYRERKVPGLHPRELIECAFDIVSPPSSSLLSDAEVMCVIQEIVDEFPPLQERNYAVRINHHTLLRAALLHCGLADKQHQAVLQLFADLQHDHIKKADVQDALTKLGVTDRHVGLLLTLLHMEAPHGKVASFLRCITKAKSQASLLTKQALRELEIITGHAQAMGLRMQVFVAVGLVYNIQQYSGIIFQVSATMRRKNNVTLDVLAAGGRYDKLVQKFQTPGPIPELSTPHVSAVGLSIGLEKIVSAMMETTNPQQVSSCDVLLCTMGHRPMLRERLAMAKQLWNAGIRVELKYELIESGEEVQEYCRSQAISFLVLLKDTDSNSVRVRSIERDKVTEKKLNSPDLLEYLQLKIFTLRSDTVPEVNNVWQSRQSQVTPSNAVSESTQLNTLSSSQPSFILRFINPETAKASAINKRKCESQILPRLWSSFGWLPGKTLVHVLVADLPTAVIRDTAGLVDLASDETKFTESINKVVEKYPRYKKFMREISDDISNLKYADTQKPCLIMLYSLKDDMYKLLS